MWCPWDDSKTPRGQPTSSLTTKAGRQATSVNKFISCANVSKLGLRLRGRTRLLTAADGVEVVLFLVPLRGVDV